MPPDADTDDHETVKTGLSLPRRDLDKLDARKRALDARKARSVSRSEVIRRCALVGLQANEVIDDKFRRDPDLRERMGQARSAMAMYEPEQYDTTDALVEALAEAEGVEPDALRDAIRRLQLDD